MTDLPTPRPDFTSPLTGIEVRQPCPYCGDHQMIPRSQFAEHVARLHTDAAPAPVPVAHATPSSSEEGETEAYASCPGYEASPNLCRCPCYGCKHNCGAHQPPDDTDLTEADIDRMMADGVPVQIVSGPPPTYAAPAPEPGLREPHANPPGSTQEQLPPAVLALIDTGDYLSTACDTALRLERAPAPTPTSGGAIPNVAWYVEQMHARCRRNHKFTGQPCACRCHRETT